MVGYPILAIITLNDQPDLQYNEVRIWEVYMTAVCLALIIYELATCLCSDEEYPPFIYRKNDLEQAHDTIYSRRA